MNKVIIISLIFVGYCLSSVNAQNNKFAIGLGYPYLCMNYKLSSKITPEIRYATGEGIHVIAARGYFKFYNTEKLNAFTGLEAGYIIFDTLDIKGSGYEGSIFIGGEYFIFDKLSLSLDIAPTYIGLQDKGFDLSVGGIEWVTSLIVYYHF